MFLMAAVRCPDCGVAYDNTYRWTRCPHERFEMGSTTMRADGTVRKCRTVTEQSAFLRGLIDEKEEFLD